jgi:hypothetical protein
MPMMWHINDPSQSSVVLPVKEQDDLKHPGRLVVQQVLPPACWHNLWQDNDRHPTLWLPSVSCFEVRQEMR